MQGRPFHRRWRSLLRLCVGRLARGSARCQNISGVKSGYHRRAQKIGQTRSLFDICLSKEWCGWGLVPPHIHHGGWTSPGRSGESAWTHGSQGEESRTDWRCSGEQYQAFWHRPHHIAVVFPQRRQGLLISVMASMGGFQKKGEK